MSKTIWQPNIRKSDAPIYRAIADALEGDIAAGVIRAGSRLPTHRDLARALGVTTLTITRAYSEAARRGLLESTVGRGTFVRTMTATEERTAVDLSRNIIGGGEDVELPRDLTGELRRLLRGADYQTPASGTARHKAAAAAWMNRFGVNVTPDRPFIVAGAQHALTVLLMSLVEPKGSVLCEPLMYPGFRALLPMLRLNAEIVDIDEEGIQPKALDQACRTSRARVLYCVPTFQNPTGGVMSKERRQEIAVVARRHGLTIIEDDCYGFLQSPKLPPLASILPEQTCYITTSSKSISPSLRTGFIAAPAPLFARLEAAVYATLSFTSTITAEIFTAIVESGEADRLVERKRQIITEHQKVARKILGPWIETTQQGSPHIWLSLPDQWHAAEFAQETAARGVTIAPASVFALDRRHLRNCVRIALGAVATLELKNALTTVGAVLEGDPMAAAPVV